MDQFFGIITFNEEVVISRCGKVIGSAFSKA
jgi:hypothetical protein